MTAEQAMAFPPGEQHHYETPPKPSERQRVLEEEFLFDDFKHFCLQEAGIDLSRNPSIGQELIADTAHSFIVGNVLDVINRGEGKLLPAGQLQTQMREYYHFHSPRVTNNPARKQQEIAYRQRHIQLAITQKHQYPQIDYAERLLHSALRSRQRIVAYGIADLLTTYGMTLEQLGIRFGNTAIRQPGH